MLGRWDFRYENSRRGIAHIDRHEPDGKFSGTLNTGSRARIHGILEGKDVTLTVKSSTRVIFTVTVDTHLKGQLLSRGSRARIAGTWEGVSSSGRFTMERLED